MFANHDFTRVSFNKLLIFDRPEEITFGELYYRNAPCYKVKKLICFHKKVYKIFYENGRTMVAFPQEIKIIKDVLTDVEQAKSVMAYYRRVVQEIVTSEEDEFLVREFDDIDYVNEESVLALYLKGELARNHEPLKHPLIVPFGVNLSQLNALKMMFSHRISIVEGPPGTGKTQTILNFIANALINGKSVAVVSNNNAATDNVYEKLAKYGYSFFAAPLGNADNVEKFFETYHPEIPELPSDPVDVRALRNTSIVLPECFAIENKKKKVIDKLSRIELEYKHFLNDHKGMSFDDFKYRSDKVKPETIARIMVSLKESRRKPSFLKKLYIRFKLRIGKSLFRHNAVEIDAILQHLYYLAKIFEAKNELAELDRRMDNQTLEEKVKRVTSLSKAYFEKELSSIFANRDREGYARDNYKFQFSDFVKDYPVILSSTYSLAKCSQRGYLFDYLVVDESSQVNMASAILSMRMARNLIVVGDIKQLPQIDDDGFASRNEKLLKLFSIPRTYSYYGNSIMSSLLSLYGKAIPRTMLKEHYRCNPDIINFCNERFYNGELIIYTKPRTEGCSMQVIKTVPGNFARKNPTGTGLYNQREIDEIRALLDQEHLEDVGVIAPYRFQAECIGEELQDQVEASTIHKFQGREKKTIIFSSTVNDSNGFVENDNLINVAVSRAIDRFILVTSDKVASSSSGVLSDLVHYIQYHSAFGQMKEGNIRSIYDLLYDEYQEQLIRFRKYHPSPDFDSENLTKVLLAKILKESKYHHLGFRMHVSLRDFINASNLDLNEEEQHFLGNPWSHADFLIYNRITHQPVLVIEVDGVAYHEQQEAQLARDKIKDAILNKSGIHLIRLKTNQSEEEKRIKQALDTI